MQDTFAKNQVMETSVIESSPFYHHHQTDQRDNQFAMVYVDPNCKMETSAAFAQIRWNPFK